MSGLTQTFQFWSLFQLVKIDTMTKQSWVWEEEGTYVAEPVFIPGPGATDEDDGKHDVGVTSSHVKTYIHRVARIQFSREAL